MATSATAARGAPTIHPNQADRYVGREVVVEGYVERVICSVQACVMSFGPAFSGLVVAVPTTVAPSLASGKDQYEGHTIRVRGVVEAPNGRPRIEVDHLDDVERIELEVGVRGSQVVSRTESGGAAGDDASSSGRSVTVQTAPEPEGPSVSEIARALESEADPRPRSAAGVAALAARVSALEERAGESAALPPGLLPLSNGPTVLQRPDEMTELHAQLEVMDARLLDLLDEMAALEDRIAALEQIMGGGVAAPPLPSDIPGSRSPTLSRVRRGWSVDRVLRTVGEPQHIVSRGRGAAVWHYDGGRSVTVDERGRVTSAIGF